MHAGPRSRGDVGSGAFNGGGILGSHDPPPVVAREASEQLSIDSGSEGASGRSGGKQTRIRIHRPPTSHEIGSGIGSAESGGEGTTPRRHESPDNGTSGRAVIDGRVDDDDDDDDDDGLQASWPGTRNRNRNRTRQGSDADTNTTVATGTGTGARSPGAHLREHAREHDRRKDSFSMSVSPPLEPMASDDCDSELRPTTGTPLLQPMRLPTSSASASASASGDGDGDGDRSYGNEGEGEMPEIALVGQERGLAAIAARPT